MSSACVVCMLVQGNAQENKKNELGLLLGAIVTPTLTTAGPAPTQIEVSPGITFQLNYARRLWLTRSAGLYLEIPALAIPLQEIRATNTSVPKNYDSFFVTPSLRVQLAPRNRISPWFSVGGGYALFDESVERLNGTHNITRGTSGGAVQFGGGLDLRTPIQLLFPIGVRMEVRDLYTAKPNYNVETGSGFQHNLVFSGGLVLRF